MKDKYPIEGMIVLTFLGLFGVVFLILSGLFSIRDFDDLMNYLSVYLMLLIFCLFFIGICLYCWISYVKNVVIKPKKQILYLKKVENGSEIFVDKKGKEFTFDNCRHKVGKYYYVLKTSDYIHKVLNESNDVFNLKKEKKKKEKSYWLNYYSPLGNFENMLLLPIIYIILIPGVLCIIMAEGFAKIYGIILSVFPLYFIIYDLIYKYKLSKHEYIDDNKLINSYFILENSISIIVYFIINVIFMRWFISTENIIEKLILSPFCLCLLCALGLAIAKAFDKKLLESIFKKLYIVIFLIYWFGMLIYFTISIIKLYKFNIMLLLTIPFWLAGFYILYKLFINKSSKGDE